MALESGIQGDWRHDIQHNDTQYNNIQHSDTRYNKINKHSA